jgi:hypothetical protein
MVVKIRGPIGHSRLPVEALPDLKWIVRLGLYDSAMASFALAQSFMDYMEKVPLFSSGLCFSHPWEYLRLQMTVGNLSNQMHRFGYWELSPLLIPLAPFPALRKHCGGGLLIWCGRLTELRVEYGIVPIPEPIWDAFYHSRWVKFRALDFLLSHPADIGLPREMVQELMFTVFGHSPFDEEFCPLEG